MTQINLSKDEVYNLFKTIKNSDWEMISFDVQPLSDTPVGYLGDHFYLNIKTVKKESRIKDNLRFFIKTLPTAGEHGQYVEDIGVFKKEVDVQKYLLPKLQKATNFLKYSWLPKCHISKDDLILFDDLTMDGYKIKEGREIFDFNHAVAALKTLADFHAASLIWEENQKKKNDKLYSIADLHPKAITEVCYVQEKGHTRNKWLKSATKATVCLCNLTGHLKESDKVTKTIDKIVKIVGPSNRWRNVLSHADLWSNNFMFKYNNDHSIEHSVLIDYQFTRYSPPALDLISCIHLTTPLDLRSKHMDYFIDVYYKRLGETLSRVKLDIDDILTHQELVEGCEFYKPIGIIETIFFGTIIWIPGELSKEMLDNCLEFTLGDRSPIVEKAFNADDFFKGQMTDAITELLMYM